MNIEGTVSFKRNIFHLFLRLDDSGAYVGTLFEIDIGVVVNLEDVVSSSIVIDVCLEDIILVWSEIFKYLVAFRSHGDYVFRWNSEFGIDK